MQNNILPTSYNKDFLTMIGYAIKAPSGHNTQPWNFKLSDTSIEILPNFAQTLPAVDADNRELFISLGCALENICITADYFGYNYNITKQNEKSIIIDLEKTNVPVQNSLFQQIEKRQTNRNVYKIQTINSSLIAQLNNIPLQENINIYIYEKGTNNFDILSEYILKGNEIQMNDKAFKEELVSWMRFTKGEISKTQNGLTFSALGFPSIPRFLGKPIVKSYLKPKKQNKTDLKKIQSSSHFVLFTTKNNTVTEWINLGRSLENVTLKATELGIANAFLNPPCEVEMLANELKTKLPINNNHPTILMRIGYADTMPYSPRKSIEDVIIIE